MREHWPLWLRLAWLEAWGDKAFSLTFGLSLSLGLSGFLLLDAFKASVSAHLDARSKGMLAADVAVSATHAFTDEQLAQLTAALPPGSATRRETSLMSMAAVEGQSRLVELRAIDAAFPFYGDFILHAGGRVDGGAPKAIVDQPLAWVYPELLLQLHARIGDRVKIGDASFTIADVVDEDPALSSSAMALAPRVFIGQAFLPDTGLVTLGSRVTHALLVRLPPGAPPGADVVKALRRAVPREAGLRLRTHRDASEDLNRLLIYLNDYLGLVALVALFLSALGGAYLYRSFLARRTRDIAILLSLGGGIGLARRVYAAQLVLLGTFATAVSALVTLALLPLLPRVFAGLLPDDLTLGIPPLSIALAFALGTAGAILFCLPILGRIGSVNPTALFQEAAAPRLEVSQRTALGWVPAVVVYWLLAVWQAQSLKIGSLFVGLFLGSSLILTVAGLGFLRLLDRPRQRLTLELASQNLARHRTATLACFLAISLGAMLLNLVPQIRVVVDRELAQPAGEKLPSLFLIDVQDEQVAPLKAKLEAEGSQLKFLSPLIRARLETVRGKPVGDEEPGAALAQTREDEQESRMRNRGYNLSYRTELSPSEELVAGRPFSGRYDWNAQKPAELSLEVRFAERLGVGLGDRLAFDVQGVAFEGEVTSLRRVRWTSFQPNFFVQVQPGVLDDAPKSFIGAIPELPLERKVALQDALVKAFPNVSIIDVGSTVQRILAIIEQISVAVAFMALLSLIAGAAVLFAIASHQAQQRLRDTTLLKVLGAGFGRLRLVALTEFSLLGASAGALGALLSVGVSWALSVVIFDRAPFASALAWRVPVLSAVAITVLAVAIGLAANGRALRAKPISLLNAPRV
jgi:putative ABC transport system permease protein